MSGLASRMKHRTSVTQRRQQWRRRSAAARERKAHPLFRDRRRKIEFGNVDVGFPIQRRKKL